MTATSSPVRAPAKLPRIPLSLQAVFLASNRGNEVDQPPPDRVAFQVFSHARSRVFWQKTHYRAPRRGSMTKTKTTFHSHSHHLRTKAGMGGLARTPSFKIEKMSKDRKFKRKFVRVTLKPQAYLDALLRPRGYSTETHKTLQTAYYNKPTALQLASYHSKLLDLVRKDERKEFKSFMSTGISLNPANRHGESLVHYVCRMGRSECLQTLVDLGCSVQVSNDCGRTPLHDACWAPKPCFKTVEILLKQDWRLLYMRDCHGHLPLSYVRQEQWGAWLEFLQSKKETVWPKLQDEAQDEAADLAAMEAGTRPVPDPTGALTPKLAALVVKGKLPPEELLLLKKTMRLLAKEESKDKLSSKEDVDPSKSSEADEEVAHDGNDDWEEEDESEYPYNDEDGDHDDDESDFTESTFDAAESEVFLWQRLAKLDLSSDGHQPLESDAPNSRKEQCLPPDSTESAKKPAVMPTKPLRLSWLSFRPRAQQESAKSA